MLCFLLSLLTFFSFSFSFFKVGEGDLEEYDFDDYNSIASTASLLNIHAELAQDEKNFAVRNHAQTPTNETMALTTSQSRSTGMHETVINGEDRSQAHLREQLLRISKVQASISKVRNWSKFVNGSLNKEEWKDLLLEAAQQGDLKRVVRVLFYIWKSATYKQSSEGQTLLFYIGSNIPLCAYNDTLTYRLTE